MGNRHGAETFTPRIVNPLEHPSLHWTWENGKPEYTPSVGTSMVLSFGRAEVLQRGVNGYNVGNIRTKMTFSMDLAPRIISLPPPQFRTDEQAKTVVESVISHISGFAEMTEANVIVARHGRMWGLFPEKAIAEALVKRGFEVPMVFPKVGGRNRIQEHAVLLLNR